MQSNRDDTSDANRGFRRNLLLLMSDFAAYGFGMSFVSIVTILPMFVSNLTSSSVAIGLIVSIMTLGFNLPQILVSKRIEAFSRKKPYFMRVTMGERIPWLILAALAFAFGNTNPTGLLTAFFLLYALINTSAGLATPAWLEIVAKAVPDTRRGMFFGISNFAASLLSVAGGIAAGFFIQRFAFPFGYAACFLSAFVMTMIGYLALAFVNEPQSVRSESETRPREKTPTYTQIIKGDANFRTYLLANLIGGIGTMASSFFIVQALRVSSNIGSEIGLFTAAYAAAGILSNLMWAYVADVNGHKAVLLISGSFSVLASLIAIVSTDLFGFLSLFVLAGAASSAYIVSAFPIVMDFAPSERRPTYYAIANGIRAPFAALAPLLGGLIADALGYGPVFMISGFASLISIGLLWVVKEPRIDRS